MLKWKAWCCSMVLEMTQLVSVVLPAFFVLKPPDPLVGLTVGGTAKGVCSKLPFSTCENALPRQHTNSAGSSVFTGNTRRVPAEGVSFFMGLELVFRNCLFLVS